MKPDRIGRYEIERVLGEGGMGAVYAGRDSESGERVALKVLSSSLLEDEAKFLRFEQEVVALTRLSHPNIVRLLGPIERHESQVFFAMELLEGETLSARLRREGPMPIPAALSIVRPVLAALDEAHRAGVVHRDVKPSNIILAGDCVKITDFGLAHMDDLTRLTQTGQIMGTLDYMSPEQCEGASIDGRSDLYSIGIVLYEMLTGKPPFRRPTPGAVIKGHLTDPPAPIEKIRADLPGGLPEIVDRLLAKDPADRYATAEEAIEALERVHDPSRTVTFHSGLNLDDDSAITVPLPNHRRLLLGGGTILAVALLAAGGFLLLDSGGPPGNGESATRDPPRTPPPLPDEKPDRSPAGRLQTIHGALRERSYKDFAACFERLALIGRLGENPDRTYRKRTAKLSDFEFVARLPLRGVPSASHTMRVVTSPSLSATLGFKPGRPLYVVFRQKDGLIARVADEPLGRRPPSAARTDRDRRTLHRLVQEIFTRMKEHGPELFERMVERGYLSAEKAKVCREKLIELASTGKLDFRILGEQSVYEPQRAEITIRSRALAEVLSHESDRYVVFFKKSARERTWRFMGIRAAGR